MLIAAIGDGNNMTTNYSSYTITKIDKVNPTIKAKNNPLILGTQDYNFESNVITEFGISGGNLTCDPGTSKKTGVYNVLCTALGNNGLKAEITFEVKHSYPAEYVPKTCKTEGAWYIVSGPYGPDTSGQMYWAAYCSSCGAKRNFYSSVAYGMHTCRTWDCSYYDCPIPNSEYNKSTGMCDYK